MARIAPVTSADQVPAEQRGIVEALIASRGSIQPPFSYLMNSPEVAGRAERLSAYLRFDSKAAPLYIRLVALSIAREFDCAYVWGVNRPGAQGSGISDETVEAIASEGPLDAAPPDQAAILRFIRELLRNHRVADATYAAAKDVLGEQTLVDLTASMGYYSLLAFTLNGFEVESAPGAAVLPPRTRA